MSAFSRDPPIARELVLSSRKQSQMKNFYRYGRFMSKFDVQKAKIELLDQKFNHKPIIYEFKKSSEL